MNNWIVLEKINNASTEYRIFRDVEDAWKWLQKYHSQLIRQDWFEGKKGFIKDVYKQKEKDGYVRSAGYEYTHYNNGKDSARGCTVYWLKFETFKYSEISNYLYSDNL